MAKQQPVILIDGSSYLYRAYHGLPPLVNSKNQPTGAIYGVVNMLKKMMQNYPLSHVVVIFDAKGKTFRSDWYPEYKANRPPMPDDLRCQIEPLHALVKDLGFPLLCVPGVEADDVIGTLATQASNDGQTVLVSTGDKDMAQLVNEHVTLINTMTNTHMDGEGVIEKFGVPPCAIVDYLTLIGDTVDNVPGVPKVGPKTATKWLNQYHTLDNIIENADEFKGKVGEYLREAIPNLPLSKKLVTIKTDVELDTTWQELTLGEPDKEDLAKHFEELEFKTWRRELDSATPKKVIERKYQTILDKKSFEKWLKKLTAAKLIAFDTETTSLDYMQAKLVGLSFATEPYEACYIPVGHDYEEAPEQLDLDWVLAQLKPLFENKRIKKVGHHIKYDCEVLANYDIDVKGVAYDTMLESYVKNSVASRHDLDTLALKYLSHETTHFEDVAGKGAKQVTFNLVSIEDAAPYAAEDASITLELHHYFYPRIHEHLKLPYIFDDIEIPLIGVLKDIERRGVLIDTGLLATQSVEIAERIQAIETKTFDLAGSEFNLNSPAQLQEILYEKLGLPILKKTPKGQPSTAEPVLQELAHDYPLPKLIIEHRQLSKLKSTYTDQLPEQVNPNTGRVHTSYHQAVTATGRLSSSNPNLQNIPIRTEEGRRIRKAFIAPKGMKMVAADYSQIELRIMAHLSNDDGLINAFNNGLDIHKATAAEVFNTALEDVSDSQRRSAKAINFGLIYGMSAFGLARQLDIDRTSAQNYINLYFERYPKVKAYMDDIREKAHKQGFVETLFGRRLYLPLINTRNKGQQQAAERTAINAPMQGTAADIIKLAMIAINKTLHESKLNAKIIMQVHDELVFEVEENILEDTISLIRNEMEFAAKLSIPLIVDIGVGENWDEAH